MKISKINLTKSKTVGIAQVNGRTNFNKVTIMAEAELNEKDNPDEEYKKLSQYIENNLNYEKTIK